MRTLETVDRALQLLQTFERPGQELTVSAFATRLGIHRSSASRLAATLAERGFLQRASGSEAFRLGPEVGRLGMLMVASRNLTVDAREAMVELADETGETVVLSVLDKGQALDIAQVHGAGHLIGGQNWLGRRAPLHASSDGKVLLAFADVDLSDLELPAATQHTITDLDELRAEVARVRDRGWATAVGELEDGLRGVAVPVWDHTDQCVAALSVSGPEYRLSDQRLSEIASLAQAAARKISGRLGHVARDSD